MKKFFFVVFVLCLTSVVFNGCGKKKNNSGISVSSRSLEECDDTTEKCWKMWYKVMGVTSGEVYEWGTEKEVVRIWKTSSEFVSMGEMYYTETKNVTTEAKCEELDMDANN